MAWFQRKSLALCGLVQALLGQQAVAQTLRGAVDSKVDSTRVQIFADGNIRAVATGSNENTAGTGALGFVVRRMPWQWSGSVNIASTIDTLEAKPGASLLSPATGQAFQSGLLDYRRAFRRKAHPPSNGRDSADSQGQPRRPEVEDVKPWGVHAYLSAGKSLWALDSATVVDAVVFGFGGTVFHDIVHGTAGENDVRMTIELGLSARKVGGDVGTDSRDALRTAFLGTESTFFFGLEGGMQLQFNSIVAGIQLYYLRDLENGADVDGLTRLQLVGGISVQGPIFTGLLK